MKKTVSTAQMKAIDARAIEQLGISSLYLMENAARHTADAAEALLAENEHPSACIMCGTGNNGGDGLACARILSGRGIPVQVFLVGNPEKLTPDASVNARRLEETGIAVTAYTGQSLPECGCIVDALFGFGLNREVGGIYRTAIEEMNRSSAPIVACDIPSGLNGDTGVPMGIAVQANTTVSFTCAKMGLINPEASRYVGQLRIADIGIPEELLN